jgi:hypothetical protein
MAAGFAPCCRGHSHRCERAHGQTDFGDPFAVLRTVQERDSTHDQRGSLAERSTYLGSVGPRDRLMYLRGATLITTQDIRRWATALPEVEETTHFRFHVPQFKVRGSTFAGLGADATTAVFCVSEQDAARASAADPATCKAVRRMDARRSFLGLEVQLRTVSRVQARGCLAHAGAEALGSRVRKGCSR